MTSERLLRLPEVLARTGLSRTAIYDRITPKSRRFDPSFPCPVRLGARAIAFREHELTAWVEKRPPAREAAKP